MAAAVALCLLRSALLIINQDWEKVTAASPGVTVAVESLIIILFLLVWPMASALPRWFTCGRRPQCHGDWWSVSLLLCVFVPPPSGTLEY